MAREYHKGDDQAGGGGSTGGGGKRRRPERGWEKGDVARGVAAARPEAEMPRKPGRRIPEQVEQARREAPEPGTSPIVDMLVKNNAKLLTTLRKLDTIRGDEPRSTLLDEVEDQLDTSRRIEQMLRPLLDSPVDDALLELDELDRTIDRRLERLREPARPHELRMAVQALRGMIEQRIERERERLIPAYQRDVGPEQGLDLAQRLQ